MTTVSPRTTEKEISHLMRRIGFGGSKEEIDQLTNKSYDDAVDFLMDNSDENPVPTDLLRRYQIDLSDVRSVNSSGAFWMYRLAHSKFPFDDKVALFWHRVFATGQNKLIQGKVMTTQIDMFKKHGLGSFENLLIELSKDPAMIMWLDNQDNHKDNINENYGREILELFSMGVGNYSEEDIKECSRAFTGWTVENMPYMAIKMRNNTARPFGYVAWQFKFDQNDHDFGEKEFLGEKGNFNGEDIVKIICKQKATAKYLARHIYHFFVKDELPVPQWPHEEPVDPDAVNFIMDSYFKNNYNIKETLRDLFKSKYFRNENIYYKRIKSPAELVVNSVRLSGGFEIPSEEVYKATISSGLMGQPLLNPTSVEGWQGGEEWINTGSVIERINFCSDVLGDSKKVLVRKILKRNPQKEDLLRISCEELGYFELHESTEKELISYINDNEFKIDEEYVGILLKLIVSSREFQMT
ncbi:MAG: DUF1800 domain-containing protein [SAR202 cluster bacterium]|jgi:uncharacterized protein (DUF1800 family)|nr:hypothetical protein [Chloroflexota bacterium]MQF83274.1 DUF1800 domain-containing protein [SAR202 cluster bacterium]MQG20228.1 DUF1800 domain-containing protein [SAR202 cluster bacterium]|tara:strand:- start:153 stop:1556 length:1404 start_codon:yes stop_codon:yes gene_type:complete